MDLPRRIFIALGEPSDVSSVASSDVQLRDAEKKLKEAIRKREEAEKQAKELEEFIYRRREQNETVLGGVLLLVLISAFSFVIWLCLQPAQPPLTSPPATLAPQPTVQPHHDCKRGCGPPYYWEYEDFECWRHRGRRGLCFN
jgi:hypothetical protein